MYSLVLTAEPEIEPITLDEARQHRKVDFDLTEDDELIEAIITAAREHAESRTRRKLITQSWTVYLDSFGSAGRDAIKLPLSPVQSVDFVKYHDANNALQTMDAALYEFDQAALRPRLQPVANQTWPATYDRLSAVQIGLTVGFGDEAANVPRSIRQWMLCMIAELDEHRILTSERGALAINPFIDGLLDPYRIVEF